MKTCPYCAEEIQDTAIKCRWCQSWLVDDIPAGAGGPAPAEATAGAPEAEAKAKAPKTAKPAEPEAEVPKPAEPEPAEPEPAEPEPAPAAQTSQPDPAAQSAVPTQGPTIEFTHTGSRYLLGYAPDFFGIWDRNAPQQPVERFPRNDEGWGAAWARYSQMESNWMDLRTGQKSG